MEGITLNNGVIMPSIGFGTWQIPDGEKVYNAVLCALGNGYRHIDTARTYGNEAGIGRAIKDSGIPRKELFVTSKLPAACKSYKETFESFNKSMEALRLDYLDLYLIHAPWPWDKRRHDYSKQNVEVWKAMEEIYKSGRCRAIGVSNFEITDLTAILTDCTVKPMVNQIRYFIGYTQKELSAFCHQNGIALEGYSPFATGAILTNSKVAGMAGKYNTTLPQLCIRYVLQKGVAPLPKSVNPEHIKLNTVVDFEISAADMEYLDGLTNTVKGLFLSDLKAKIRKKLLVAEVLIRYLDKLRK